MINLNKIKVGQEVTFEHGGYGSVVVNSNGYLVITADEQRDYNTYLFQSDNGKAVNAGITDGNIDVLDTVLSAGLFSLDMLDKGDEVVLKNSKEARFVAVITPELIVTSGVSLLDQVWRISDGVCTSSDHCDIFIDVEKTAAAKLKKASQDD